MAFETLVVSESGAELSYIDSGPPSKSPYITLFAVHGMCFTNLIFQNVQPILLAQGVRLVAPNRRHFPGSTPYTPEELGVVLGGSEEQKDAWVASRGHELLTFIDTFCQKHNIPPISADGKSGGIAILGWSLGVPFANAALSSVHNFPADVRARLGSRLRAYMAHEPAPAALGLPSPEKNWAPVLEETIPAELRLKAFTHWVTAYFEHEDLPKRDLNTLSYVLESTIRPPSIFNMTKAQIKEMVMSGQDASLDLPFLFTFPSQLKSCYRKVFFDPATAKAFPKMKISFLTGDLSPAWAPAAWWAVEDEDKKLGNGRIDFKLLHGVNHFLQWDDPQKAVDVYIECMKV